MARRKAILTRLPLQPGSTVNWGDPLTAGLVRLVTFVGGQAFDLVTQKFLTRVGNAITPVTSGGAVGLANTGETSYWTMPVHANSNVQSLSVLWVGSTQGGTSSIILRDASNSGGTIPVWRNSGFDVRLGAVDFTPPAPAFNLNTTYAYAVSSSTTATIAIDGQTYALSGTPSGTGLNDPWYIHQNGNTGQGGLHTSQLLGIWSISLTALQLAMITRNPARLISPMRRRRTVGAPVTSMFNPISGRGGSAAQPVVHF